MVGEKKLTWVNRHKLPGLNAARHVIMVPDLIERAVATADRYRMTVSCREGGLDLGRSVCLVVRGENAGGCEELRDWISRMDMTSVYREHT